MRTTDTIIADLQARAATGADVRQQIIAHESMARLRAELAAVMDPEYAAALRQQIGMYRRMVDEDVDEQPATDAAAPKPESIDAPPAGDAAVPELAPAKASRTTAR